MEIISAINMAILCIASLMNACELFVPGDVSSTVGREPTIAPDLGANDTVMGIEIRNQPVYENRERVNILMAESQKYDDYEANGLSTIIRRSEAWLSITSQNGMKERIAHPEKDKDNPSAKDKPEYCLEVSRNPKSTNTLII